MQCGCLYHDVTLQYGSQYQFILLQCGSQYQFILLQYDSQYQFILLQCGSQYQFILLQCGSQYQFILLQLDSQYQFILLQCDSQYQFILLQCGKPIPTHNIIWQPMPDRLVGLVVRRPPRERKVPGSNPACAGIFWGLSHTCDLNIGTPVATLPGAWRYRVIAGTGRPGVSIL